jgi:transposase
MDDQLERNVLGCILSGAEIPPVLDVGMFASVRNRIVFKALGTMKEQGNAPDLVALAHYLQSIGKLDEAGGPAYVAALTSDVFPSQIQYFSETLVRRYRDRKYETAIKLAAENIGKEPTDWIVQDLQNKLEAQAPDPGGGLRFERVGGMEVKCQKCRNDIIKTVKSRHGGSMEFISGEDRNQIILLSDSVEDYVDDNNAVRVIDVYINSLDLAALGFSRPQPHETGRPMYDPRDLLKLYVYGYMNRLRSSRRLETETKRNLEVMWLLGRLSPDHKTIAHFRHENGAALKNVFRDFVGLCVKLGLYGKELAAIDGSKFKAVNSKEHNFTMGKLRDRIARLETQYRRVSARVGGQRREGKHRGW